METYEVAKNAGKILFEKELASYIELTVYRKNENGEPLKETHHLTRDSSNGVNFNHTFELKPLFADV